MFNEGDIVRNVSADIVGVVVEVDGKTVYLEQENGVESIFPLPRWFSKKRFRPSTTIRCAKARKVT